MSDNIVLAGIEVYAYGGVTEEERCVGQRYRVDLTLELDLETAARTDDLANTVSYALVHDLVIDTMRRRPFRLIESAARDILIAVLQQTPVTRADIELQKLLPPVDGVVLYAAVRLSRDAAWAEAQVRLFGSD